MRSLLLLASSALTLSAAAALAADTSAGAPPVVGKPHVMPADTKHDMKHDMHTGTQDTKDTKGIVDPKDTTSEAPQTNSAAPTASGAAQH